MADPQETPQTPGDPQAADAPKVPAKTPAKKAPAKAAKKAPAKKAPAKKAPAKKAAVKAAEPPVPPAPPAPAEVVVPVSVGAKEAAAQAKTTVEEAFDSVAAPLVQPAERSRSPLPIAVAAVVSLLALLVVRQLRRSSAPR